MMLDHFHRRSNDCNDVEDENSSVLKRHESFTFDILASSEAKVIILYGGKVQKRLLKVRKFAFLLLWGRFKGILVGLDREDNYKEPDNRYRFRRVFFFAKHPNHLMYQAKGNDVLKRHDLITEAAAEMAGESDLAQANFYCNKLWKKTDPRRQAILKEARSRGLQFSRQMLSTAVPPSSSSALDKTPQLDWDNFFLGSRHIATNCYSRKYSRVPLRSGKKRERKTNFIGTVHPTSLPPSLDGFKDHDMLCLILHQCQNLPRKSSPRFIDWHFQTKRASRGSPFTKSFGYCLKAKMIVFRKRARIEMLISCIPALGRAFSSLAPNVGGSTKTTTLSGL